MVLGATNRPDLVDAALLRPGRFDIRLYVPPPNTAEARTAILRVLTRATPLAADVALPTIADLTPGYARATTARSSYICSAAAVFRWKGIPLDMQMDADTS